MLAVLSGMARSSTAGQDVCRTGPRLPDRDTRTAHP